MGIHAGETLILGLDPGREKTGFAAVDWAGELLFSGLFPSGGREKFLSLALAAEGLSAEGLAPWLRECRVEMGRRFALAAVALGGGTGRGDLAEALTRRLGRSRVPVEIVDEAGTTLEARRLYWRLHRPGWRRFLPQGLRVPSRPLDDLAAWAIALRGLPSFVNAKKDV